MPKVNCYSAAWLSKNARGHQLFEPSPEVASSRALASPYAPKKKAFQGPRRAIARRGTEVFVAVGKEIRWGDLAYIKEEWTINQSRGHRAHIKREGSAMNMDDIPDIENAGGLRVSCHVREHLPRNPLLRQTITDNQSLRRRRYSTTHHVTKLEPPRNPHDSYRSHLCHS